MFTMKTEFHQSNHFVAEQCLKRWAGANKKIWTYRTLVPHENVVVWKDFALRGIAKRSHLYTRTVAGVETDEIERWLNDDFETPAEGPLERAATGSKLSSDDWSSLIRYVAAQDVRTPARFTEMMQRWTKHMPALLQDVMNDLVSDLKEAKRNGTAPKNPTNSTMNSYLPLGINIGKGEGGSNTVVAEMIVGRGLWLFEMRTLLQSTIRHLMAHRWTIFESPGGCEWPTSDDPVIKLNYMSSKQYDFGGGWASPGTEIFMPISPRHLLYTHIGQKPAPRGTTLTLEQFTLFRRLILQHAHRFIFMKSKDPEVQALRPRTVDLAAYRSEQEQWTAWHDDQSNAESELLRKPA